MDNVDLLFSPWINDIYKPRTIGVIKGDNKISDWGTIPIALCSEGPDWEHLWLTMVSSISLPIWWLSWVLDMLIIRCWIRQTLNRIVPSILQIPCITRPGQT